MWNIICEDLQTGLEHAIHRGDVGAIEHYITSFPCDETRKIIENVITKNDCAGIKSAIQENNKAVVRCLLNHEITRDRVEGLLSPDTVVREKPRAQSEQNTRSCSTRIKEGLGALLGRGVSKICPLDAKSARHQRAEDTGDHHDDSAEDKPNNRI